MMNILSYLFVQKALISGVALAIIAGVFGLFIVLRKMSLYPVAVAHFSLSGVALGLALDLPVMPLALLFGLIAGLVTKFFTNESNIDENASLGILFSIGLALGILILSLAHVGAVDIITYLFGSILAISTADVIISLIVMGTAIIFVYLVFYELISISFDKSSAKVDGVPVDIIDYLFYAISAIVVVSAIKLAGVMLVSAIVVIPSLVALKFNKEFFKTMLIAIAISLLGMIGGILLSLYIDIPAGVATVSILAVLLGISHFIK